jgi:hypothetical protein
MSTHIADRPRPADGLLDRNHRELWGAVVLQAREDIRVLPLDSIEYAQAVAFFTGAGEWAEMRTMISDFLELHRDDLEIGGRRFINERRSLERLPPIAARPLPREPARAPRAAVGRVMVKPAAQPDRAPMVVRSARPFSVKTKAPPAFNPFFPRGMQPISP